MSETTSAFNSCVTKISIGITSSYDEIGTIALLPPPIEVLKIYLVLNVMMSLALANS